MCRIGDADTYGALLSASQGLSDKELKALEDDLSYYAETGLVGVQMSKLLSYLQSESHRVAA